MNTPLLSVSAMGAGRGEGWGDRWEMGCGQRIYRGWGGPQGSQFDQISKHLNQSHHIQYPSKIF